LTFAALEKAGQKRISVFMNPKDKWEAHGLTPVKDETGAAASNRNTTSAYQAASRSGVITSDIAGLLVFRSAVPSTILSPSLGDHRG
jgi:hypothetical protein